MCPSWYERGFLSFMKTSNAISSVVFVSLSKYKNNVFCHQLTKLSSIYTNEPELGKSRYEVVHIKNSTKSVVSLDIKMKWNLPKQNFTIEIYIILYLHPFENQIHTQSQHACSKISHNLPIQSYLCMQYELEKIKVLQVLNWISTSKFKNIDTKRK